MGKELLALSKLKEMHKGSREPLQSWKWYLKAFPKIGNLVLPTSYCEELGLPFPQFAQNSKEFASTTVTFPGAISIDGFEMVLYEDQAASSMGYVQAWQSMIQNPYTGGYRVPAFYWRDLEAVLMDTRNNDIATAIIKNAWPLGMSSIQLNQAGAERVKISVQMQCTACVIVPKKIL